MPLLPHWGADWNVPLPTQNIALAKALGFSAPAGISANIGFPPQRVAMTGTMGRLLGQQLSDAAIVLTIVKTLPVSATDTIFVAADSADLKDAAAARIVVPVDLAAAESVVTDTVAVPPSGVVMLQAIALAKGSMWVQLRGRVSWSGPGSLTVTAADSVRVRLSVLATIAVSR